ncbi:MAG: YicC/YloC family endoribonuclease [Desulfosudaceae bacterium]
MIKSMTAYAEKTVQKNELTVSCEIRSYNSRYLDIIPRLPVSYRPREKDLKQLINNRIQRGRVEVTLTMSAPQGGDRADFVVDEPRVHSYYQALLRLRDLFDLDDPISLPMLVEAEGVIRREEPDQPVDEDWDLIAGAIEGALISLDDMRRKEGELLAADLLARLEVIEATVAYIKSRSANLVEEIYQRLRERVTSLTRDMVELDQSRIAQEAAFYADKADISEEIIRAESHIAQFRAAMTSDEPCGRKLNFLLQEFNREFNTMGSKTVNPDISEKVVAVKTELEKIREQAQNIE